MATPADVARLLDCTPRHARRLLAGKLIDAEKRGRDWYVSEAWVEATSKLPLNERRGMYFRRARGKTRTQWEEWAKGANR